MGFIFSGFQTVHLDMKRRRRVRYNYEWAVVESNGCIKEILPSA